MSAERIRKANNCIINTGNILSLNDITRKSGQNPSDELAEAINITIKDFDNGANLDANNDSSKLIVYRPNDDLSSKIGEHALADLKIGLKIFLNNDDKASLSEALEEAFNTLKVSCVHNVIIAHKKTASEIQDEVSSLKTIWSVLEDYVTSQKINEIGLADVEEATFRAIFEWAAVKPTIIQINLATCCVVPPTLQAFCKDNDVQLLTHSDPADFLPKKAIDEPFSSLSLKWICRFLVHIKCRGVLITKGYLVSLNDK